MLGGIGEGDNMKYGETVHGNCHRTSGTDFAVMYSVRFLMNFCTQYQ